MPLDRVIGNEWRDELADTKYPFSDNSSLINDSGRSIAASAFIDAIFYPVGGSVGGYISRIVVTANEVTITLSDSETDNYLSATFDLSAPPSVLIFTDSVGRNAGLIISDPVRLSNFGTWSQGEHLFEEDQAVFVARVWTPVPSIGVRGIILDSGDILTGDIWLVGEDGIVLSTGTSYEPDSDGGTQAVNTVRIDIVGDPLFKRKLCTDSELFQSPIFLETIRFCKPASTELARPERCFICGPGDKGDIKMSVGNQDSANTILRVQPNASGIMIEAVGERLEQLG